MPAYGLPGVSVGPRGARLVGAVAIGVVVLALVAWAANPFDETRDRLRVTLLTEEVGEGVTAGTDVRLDGVKVGSISSIEPADVGTQRIGLELDGSTVFGLTDALSIAYAPGNLFGISEVEITAGDGGSALTDGMVVDLSGRHADRVYDATLSTLLRITGQFTTQVLTPQFTEVVAEIAHNTKAFTPLLQAIVTTTTSIADTQRYASSFLIGQIGEAVSGAPPTVDGGLRLLYGPFVNSFMQSDDNRLALDATADMLTYKLLPGLGTAGETARQYFDGYTDMLAPLLYMLAGTVSAPQQSANDLGLLLDRLGNTLHDTPNGPVMNVDVLLSGVPGLAQPLTGGGR